ncbi:MAG: hypothetical protein MZV49_04905 [Rhodopseudomonas palustris]|nr:hypothetical protein [Rhodopseudomonas palustris]
MGAALYVYQGDDDDIDYVEVYGGLDYKILSTKLWIAPDYLNSGDSAFYLEGNPGGRPLPSSSGGSHLGYSGGEFFSAAEDNGHDEDYDCAVGLTRPFRRSDFELEAADGSDLDEADGEPARPRSRQLVRGPGNLQCSHHVPVVQRIARGDPYDESQPAIAVGRAGRYGARRPARPGIGHGPVRRSARPSPSPPITTSGASPRPASARRRRAASTGRARAAFTQVCGAATSTSADPGDGFDEVDLNVEVDFILGYAADFTEALGYDVGATYYKYRATTTIPLTSTTSSSTRAWASQTTPRPNSGTPDFSTPVKAPGTWR